MPVSAEDAGIVASSRFPKAAHVRAKAEFGRVFESGKRTADPLWQLPLWRPYRKMLDSYLADMANSGASRHAGAITAALYLERFVPESQAWMHLDTYAWNDADRPGRPRGGEAMGLRAFFDFLQSRYPR